MNFRLLATMVTLAAVTTATTIPANAQRRSSERNTTESRPVKSDSDRKSTVEKKSTFKESDKVQRSATIKNNGNDRNIRRYSTSEQDNRKSANAKISVPQNDNRNRNSGVQDNSRRSSGNVSERPAGSNSGYKSGNSNQRTETYSGSNRRIESQDRDNNKSATVRDRYEPNVRRSTGVNDNSRTSRPAMVEKYNLNDNDRYYSTSREYRGSNTYWNGNQRDRNMNYNRNDRDFYRNYNYNKYSHWDHNWERYRWNRDSWRDYYRSYHPYSYTFHKHYFFHNHYGHVIRKFSIAPFIFVHNHNRYYCYDGHFFRYKRGIGYILVDMPFGFMFEYLPADYERVYINGYLYFRVGNLFFEHTGYGFRLVHYPERYFAWDDGYHHNGYYFDNY